MVSDQSAVLFLMSAACLLVAAASSSTQYVGNELGDIPFRSQMHEVKLSYEPYEEAWSVFKKQYDRQYGSEKEEQYRRDVFMKNVKRMEQHNHKFFTSQTTYWMDINQFTDMTDEEYREYNKLYSGLKTFSDGSAGRLQCKKYKPSAKPVPASIDWRTKGYVTPVQDQKDCNCCWAFSTTGALEGQFYKAKKRPANESFSVQQLIDCSESFGNHGCKGGYVMKTYAYIKDAGGIETNESYPYHAAASKAGKCRFNRSLAVATVSGCYAIKQDSESDLKKAVGRKGPVVVIIDSNHTSFQHYHGGIYSEPACNSSNADHAMLVVGYDTEGGEKYWIAKNSWNTTWGERGYVRIARKKGNMCGVASHASFPVLKTL